MKISTQPLDFVGNVMRSHGASRIIFKLLANNDNSKQQIYFGGDFEVLRIIPHGELSGSYSERDGAIFKAPVKLSWLPQLFEPSQGGTCYTAPGAQLIYYPKYPEVRLSGFLRNCQGAPSELMQPPTIEERAARAETPRCLVLGICPDSSIIAYVSYWGDGIAKDANSRIQSGKTKCVASVFYELSSTNDDAREQLLRKLTEVWKKGPIASSRLDESGILIPYIAQNAAGYTLEAQFGIIPNGSSEPDFKGWELKAHSKGALTLMTPEPDSGKYLDSLDEFLLNYGRTGEVRRDFTGRHANDEYCEKSSLILRMEGYDPSSGEIKDPAGGLILRDAQGNLAAGWSFSKILTHWSKKHNQTAYVTYRKRAEDGQPKFEYGPEVLLCQGTEIKRFLTALHEGTIYHDPGINQKLINGRWVSKKRNQFRVAWNSITSLYEKSEHIWLS